MKRILSELDPSLLASLQIFPDQRTHIFANTHGKRTSFSLRLQMQRRVDDLNLLFVSCGYFHEINDWYMNLHKREGLFTDSSFEPAAYYQNVDIVILSNLKYRHEHARNYPAWGLDDVFLLPFINPHGRRSSMGDSVKEGLNIFHHYKTEFESFNKILVTTFDPNIEEIVETMKVSHFVKDRLKPQDFTRFFPVPVP